MFNFKKVLILLLILSVFLLLNSSVIAHFEEESPNVLDKATTAKISSFLHELSEAGSYENYLQTNYASVLEEKGVTAAQAVKIAKKYQDKAIGAGFDLINNRVRVIIEANNEDFKLPVEFGVEETRTAEGKMIQALVYLNKLEEVAKREDVKLVSEPLTAVALRVGVKNFLDLVPKSNSNQNLLLVLAGGVILAGVGFMVRKKVSP